MQEELEKILSRYAGNSIDFALHFDIDGKNLLQHLLHIIDKKKTQSEQDGRREALKEVRELVWTITQVENREHFLKGLEQLKKKWQLEDKITVI